MAAVVTGYLVLIEILLKLWWKHNTDKICTDSSKLVTNLLQCRIAGQHIKEKETWKYKSGL